jgi:hypothetical protein
VSRNYLTCPRCGWITRVWGRRLDAVTARGRFADHQYIHPTGAAAVPAAFQEEQSMSGTESHAHRHPHHTIIHVKHGPDDRGSGKHSLHDLAKELVEVAKRRGIDVAHAGILTDGEHVELHHAPTGENEIKD